MSNIEKQLIKSPLWGILKDYLKSKQDDQVVLMTTSNDIEGIYEARGRYKFIQEILRAENKYINKD